MSAYPETCGTYAAVLRSLWFVRSFIIAYWVTDKNIESLKGELHLLPKISMFCALSQNNQYLFEKDTYASYKKIVRELKNGIEILVDQVVFKL